MNEKTPIDDLCNILLQINDPVDMYHFLKDLCSPQELNALSERWRVCQLLSQGDLSYRDIHRITGASLTTIGRVARFLKDEPYQGYAKALDLNDNLEDDL